MTRQNLAVDHGAVRESLDARLGVIGVLQRLRVELVQLVELVALQTQLREIALGAVGRVARGLAAKRGAALRDRAMEQTLRGRHRHYRRGFAAAARLAEDRHAARVAAKGLDVVAHPCERRDEVLDAGIRRSGPLLAAQVREMQEAEEIEPVVH
jgi:hypothetical protein